MRLKPVLQAAFISVLLSGCVSSVPERAAINSEDAAQARINLGLGYLQQGEMVLARQNLERAQAFAPDDYRVHMAMAYYHQRVGEFSKAETDYTKAMRLAPKNGDILNNYGAFLCSQGKYAQAETQFKAALTIPGYYRTADSLENMGLCAMRAGKTQEAEGYLIRALKHEPAKGSRLMLLADNELKSGNRAQAQFMLATYDRVLPPSADSLWMHIRLAKINNQYSALNQYGQQLAREYPQSQRYQQFLANEY
ncbi:type IV pilus biogenesis/stability protein PilW [Plesiomonas shigelloides]|uniref:type IV pilus biogenesis/stability protein PilW n=1 Tax=Plesiomonas shigelloides TaxID=703 RepID=UPI000D12B039|nr:type IV pilus biogenesis/stability protein PilW [Plesiomonas shigelloides]AVQ87202.1 type IV pilus biogenesis/stability protein PilW [Plesiomonas shigelloides]